ncbi:MAG TPA: adenylate kinase [Candidatus Diapherotrites archaeon]|uniref:Adenylate kinase n=1 Tax=Candidatus Iainarchaeum sp. TaxID=3101447 RepID=A0A7J4IXW1_9ARCH|nr:adenylate kinase [Candidatus Diapherotrites archaeon]
MNLVLLGPPGTGKGTIAKFIEVRFGTDHISTGDLLRQEVAEKTQAGKHIEPMMNSGQLVEDGLVLRILRKKLGSLKGKSFVLDGFPRNINQGKLLEKLLSDMCLELDLVLEIDSPQDIIVKRLSARRQCVKCMRIYGLDVPSTVPGICDDCGSPTVLRKDDEPQVVRERLRLYGSITKPLSEFYQKKGLIRRIDGNRSLQEIFGEVEKVLSVYA